MSANKFYKYAGAMFFPSHAGIGPDDANQSLLVSRANWKYQPPANFELVNKRLGDVGTSCGDENSVIRGVLAPADCAIKTFDCGVITAELANVRLSCARQI